MNTRKRDGRRVLPALGIAAVLLLAVTIVAGMSGIGPTALATGQLASLESTRTANGIPDASVVSPYTEIAESIARETTSAATSQLDPTELTGADDGSLDVGAEYPSADAPPWGSSSEDRPVHRDSARNFYNKMREAGYTGSDSFIYGNNLAWETDWKKADLGGSEDIYVDNVDIMFVHSHGGDGSIWIPWGHTDTSVVPADCSWSWGDKDVEWIGIKTCLTLSDRTGWATCMNGVHLISGFTTLSASREFGGHWADQLLGWKVRIWPFGDIWLRSPKTVTQAWFSACDSQTSGAKARVIAEDWRHFNDKVWNRGGPAYGDVVDNYYHWQDHSCYKPPATQLDVDALSEAEVRTYVVDQRNVNEDYAQGIANTLGLEGTVHCPPVGSECGIVASAGGQTLTLSIETASGGYVLQNTSQLWVGQDPSQPLALPDEQAAVSLAGSFLDSHQALPGSSNMDRTSAHVEQDSQSEAAKPASGTMAAGTADVLSTQGVDVLVAYGRTLATGAPNTRGEMLLGSTVGPGSVTKLYYGGASGALRSANGQQLPIGLVGGMRDVVEGNLITTQSYTKTWEAFQEDHQLALLSYPLAWDTAVLTGQTFSPGYEQPLDVSQQELIPVWVFTADLYLGDELVGPDATIYVPASPDYYPPEVTIDAPAADETFVAGQVIDLAATTAGGYGPFTHEWSGPQGSLGSEEDIQVMLKAAPDRADESEPSPVTISLTVTNQNGQSRTAEVTVNVEGDMLYLPVIRQR